MAVDKISNIPINSKIVPSVNIGYLKTRKLIIGCFIFSCRVTNRTSAINPIRNGTYTDVVSILLSTIGFGGLIYSLSTVAEKAFTLHLL
ncbi:hypothetical protein J2T13_002472 [Paenibacillus sp. DS2015]